MKEKTEITAWNEGRGTSGGREMGCEWLGTNTLSETHLPHVQMHHVPKQKQTKGGNCDHRLIISAGQETANINFMNLVFQKYNDDVHSRHHCRMATKTKTDFDSGGINVDMYEWLETQTERRTGCIHLWMGGWRHDALLVWMKELIYHEVRPQPSPTTTTVSLQQPAASLSDLHSELTRIIKT